MNALAFEHAEEAFAGGVAAAVGHSADRTRERVFLQQALIITAGELAVSVRMKNSVRCALTLSNGHLNSSLDHPPILSMMY